MGENHRRGRKFPNGMHHPEWFKSAIQHLAVFLANLLDALTPLGGRSQHPPMQC